MSRAPSRRFHARCSPSAVTRIRHRGDSRERLPASNSRTQRWDDHRYYHHSRINQSLHLLSAISFLVAYALLFVDPAVAALLAWCVSMTSRQAGHFFFEPHGYDQVNQASDEYKEEIKVGYNLRRKIVLMAVWALSRLLLWLQPSLFGLIEPAARLAGLPARRRHRLAGARRGRPAVPRRCSCGCSRAWRPAWCG